MPRTPATEEGTPRRIHHIVAPLDADHRRVARALTARALAAAGIPEGRQRLWIPHVTLVSYEGLAPAAAVEALRPIAADTAPFVVRAHGFGLFTGDLPSELCLFIPVVRDAELDRLQHRLRAGLAAAGATIDGQSRPAVWTPHVTLVDRCLDPSGLGRVVDQLARRQHPSWKLRLDRVDAHGTTLAFTGSPAHS